MFLKWFWIKVPNIQVISDITKTNTFLSRPSAFILGHVRSYCCPICISVLASLSNIGLFCYFITLLIVLLIWTTMLYTSISFSVSSTVHGYFQSSFCPLLLLCKYCILSLRTRFNTSYLFRAEFWLLPNIGSPTVLACLQEYTGTVLKTLLIS